MKLLVFYIVYIVVLPILITASDSLAPPTSAVNLTNWREHRRKKRFILFENAGILKLVCGVTYPIDFSEKRPWRQMVLTMNLQYQFPVPPAPIYWWNKWQTRALPNGLSTVQMTNQKDHAQEFIYEFVENLMDRRGMNGRDCLLKAICENAQIHRHQGVFAEVLHRILRPHRNLEPHYKDAWRLGQKGLDCRATYCKARNCFLDDYLHVSEDFMQQHTVK